MSRLKPLLVILGPTASGKSRWAKKLAARFNAELIAADSRQIYRGMDIGTNKSPAHLVDIANPGDYFSVEDYQKLALRIIKKIHSKNKLPIIVGGTGLYIQSLVDNLRFPQAQPNTALRKKLQGKLNQKEIRKLEIILSGSNLGTKGRPLFNILQIGIKIDREKLYRRIDRRVDQMISEGLLEERRKLGKNLPKTIGYFESSAEKIKTNTRRYSRRQMTWFKRDQRIKWCEKYSEAEKLVKEFLSKYAPSH